MRLDMILPSSFNELEISRVDKVGGTPTQNFPSYIERRQGVPLSDPYGTSKQAFLFSINKDRKHGRPKNNGYPVTRFILKAKGFEKF